MCIDVGWRKLCRGDFLLHAANTYYDRRRCPGDGTTVWHLHGIAFALNGNGPSKREWTCHWQQGGWAGRQAGSGPRNHVTDWQGTGFIQWLLATALAAAQLFHTGHSSNRSPLMLKTAALVQNWSCARYALELVLSGISRCILKFIWVHHEISQMGCKGCVWSLVQITSKSQALKRK